MRPSGGSTIIEVRPSDRLRSHQTARRAPTPSVDRCAALTSAISASVSCSRSTCWSGRSRGVAVPWLQMPFRSGAPQGVRGDAVWPLAVVGIQEIVATKASAATEAMQDRGRYGLSMGVLVRQSVAQVPPHRTATQPARTVMLLGRS